MKHLFNFTIALTCVAFALAGCSDHIVINTAAAEGRSSENSAGMSHNEESSAHRQSVNVEVLSSSAFISSSNGTIEVSSSTPYSSRSIDVDGGSSDDETTSSNREAGNLPGSSVSNPSSSELIDTGEFKESIIVFSSSSAVSSSQTSDVVGLPVTINRTDFAFPGGKWKTLVLSFDDGPSQDERLIEIFNETKVKGSFHVTTRTLDMDGYVTKAQIQNGLYAGHEVSSHTKDHVPLKDVSRETVLSQVGESITILEELVPGNETINSMAYAGSLTDDQSIAVLKEMGMVVARGTSAYTGPEFGFPQDMLNWFPNSAAYNLEYMGNKLKERTQEEMAILFSWGHSYEFDGNAPWGDVTDPQHTFEQMRAYCANIGGRDDIWYAGAGELGAYLVAAMAVQEWKEANPQSEEIHNPTTISVWAKKNGVLKEIPAGQRVSYY